MQLNLMLAAPPLPLRWRERAPEDWVHERALHVTRTINRRLLRALAPLRRCGTVENAFFQRKPPGVRWRIRAHQPERAWLGLEPVLTRLKARGLISGWQRVVYEAEEFVFGGAPAMAAIHAYFDAETAAWSELAAARRRGQVPWAETLIAFAQCNEVLTAALGDCPEEVWDAWCRLAAFHGIAPARMAGARLRPRLANLPAAGAAVAVAPQIAVLAEAAARLGAQLACLQQTGRLQQGLRSVLAMVMLFQWNRLGFTPHQRRRVLHAAMQAWHPFTDPAVIAAPAPAAAAAAEAA